MSIESFRKLVIGNLNEDERAATTGDTVSPHVPEVVTTRPDRRGRLRSETWSALN